MLPRAQKREAADSQNCRRSARPCSSLRRQSASEMMPTTSPSSTTGSALTPLIQICSTTALNGVSTCTVVTDSVMTSATVQLISRFISPIVKPVGAVLEQGHMARPGGDSQLSAAVAPILV